MATNFDMNRGVTKVFRCEDDVASGDPVRIGDLVGVALTSAADEPTGETGEGWVTVALQGVLYTKDIDEGVPGSVVLTSTAASAGVGVVAEIAVSADAPEAGDLVFGHVLNEVPSGSGGTVEVKVG